MVNDSHCSKFQRRIFCKLNKCELLERIGETRKKNARVTGSSVDLVALPRCAYVNRSAHKGTNRSREATTETEKERRRLGRWKSRRYRETEKDVHTHGYSACI